MIKLCVERKVLIVSSSQWNQVVRRGFQHALRGLAPWTISGNPITRSSTSSPWRKRKKQSTRTMIPSHSIDRLEASAAPSTADQLGARSEPLIEASTDGDSSGRLNNGNLGVLIAAVTSTVTSYSITTTTYRTTAQLATTSALFCLPAGYGVC